MGFIANRSEGWVLIPLALSWMVFSILVFAYAGLYETPFLALLFLLSSGVWFLLFASFLECQRCAKHLRGRQWTLPKTMGIFALFVPPIILHQMLEVTSMLAFFCGLVTVGLLVGWKARSSWIALYATLLGSLILATVSTLCFYVEPSIPTYLDYIATLGLSTIFLLGWLLPSALFGMAVVYVQSNGSAGSLKDVGFRELSRPRSDGLMPIGMGSDKDQDEAKAVNVALLAGLAVAMVGGLLHDPSPAVGRYEQSLVWQWVSIVGGEIALLVAGMRAGSRPVLGAGKALMVGCIVAAWFAALMFDPSPALSRGNVISLLVFVPASSYSILYTLSANYLI